MPSTGCAGIGGGAAAALRASSLGWLIGISGPSTSRRAESLAAGTDGEQIAPRASRPEHRLLEGGQRYRAARLDGLAALQGGRRAAQRVAPGAGDEPALSVLDRRHEHPRELGRDL